MQNNLYFDSVAFSVAFLKHKKIHKKQYKTLKQPLKLKH